jgi:predicted Ser/Thr protein kinase
VNLDQKFLRGAFDAVRGMLDRPELDRYAIEEVLGEGAMGIVYRAHDRELGRRVAIKMMKDAAPTERFRREARAAAGIAHPNVVAVHDAGESGGRPWLVMELVEGRPMSALMREEQGKLVRILERAARGVAAAHAQGIVHRDVKPSNILVGSGDQPKVADFGLAHWADGSAGLTKTGSAIGTPLYMAPEQVLAGAITTRTDVYALGAILYEILMGRPPHEARNLVDLHARIANDEPMPPPGPPPLRAVCLKALEKDPARRYETAGAFADDLARHLRGEPVLARPLGVGARALRWIGRRRVPVGIAALAVAGFAFWMTKGDADGELTRRLVMEKIQSVRELADRMSAEGRDASPLRNAQAGAERLVQGGQPAEAMNVLDRALATVVPQLAIGDRLGMKQRAVQDLVQNWHRAGRNPAPVAAILEKFEPCVQAGRLDEAERVLDRALDLLRTTP